MLGNIKAHNNPLYAIYHILSVYAINKIHFPDNRKEYAAKTQPFSNKWVFLEYNFMEAFAFRGIGIRFPIASDYMERLPGKKQIWLALFCRKIPLW